MTDPTPHFSDSPQRHTYLQFMFAAFRADAEAAVRQIDPAKFCAFIPGHYRVVFDELIEIFTSLRTVAPTFGDDIEFRGSLEEPGILSVWYRVAYFIEKPSMRAVEYSSFDWVTFDADGKIVELRIMYNLNDLQQESFGIPLTRPNRG